MPVTVRGTDILFNDGTIQNTAASASQVTTTSVLNATAGASYGAVGTYTIAYYSTDNLIQSLITLGSTTAGSNLRAIWNSTDGSSYFSSRNLSGTWRAVGSAYTSFGGNAIDAISRILWLRIS